MLMNIEPQNMARSALMKANDIVVDMYGEWDSSEVDKTELVSRVALLIMQGALAKEIHQLNNTVVLAMKAYTGEP